MCQDSSAMMWGQAGGESAEPCWALLREKGAMPCYKCLTYIRLIIYIRASAVPPMRSANFETLILPR